MKPYTDLMSYATGWLAFQAHWSRHSAGIALAFLSQSMAALGQKGRQ